MGIYINPSDMSKEDFLAKHGRQITEPTFRNFTVPDDEAWVCLFNNGAFTAAGVAYDEGEAKEFSQPDDPRPRQFFAVPLEALASVLSENDMDRIAVNKIART